MKERVTVKKKRHSLLIVDDLKSIRVSLQDILSDDYDCKICSSGIQAMYILEKEKIDLLLTDIRMPGMNGIELIRQVRVRYPNLVCVLMTAYNTNEYLQYVRVEKIKNIIPKASMSDLSGFHVLIRKLLKEIDIFGVSHYYPDIHHQKITVSEMRERNLTADHSIFTVEIDNLQQYREVSRIVWSNFLSSIYDDPMVALVLEELCSNVMQHLYFHNKIPLDNDLILEFQPTFELSFGHHDNAIIIQVLDKKGVLNQETILKTLEDQIKNEERFRDRNPDHLREVIRQGRGLHLSRELSDRLIFNIRNKVQTEVIAIILKDNMNGSKTKPYSSLFIFEEQG